jgi:DNA mismatch repair ATPase MutS
MRSAPSSSSELFEELRALVVARASALRAAAEAVATLDALVSFARVSSESGYVRPTIDESSVIELTGGPAPGRGEGARCRDPSFPTTFGSTAKTRRC